MIHPRVLYESRDVITKYITVLFNESLNCGVVPSDWRKSTVHALFKKESKSNVANYRTIFQTSIVIILASDAF